MPNETSGERGPKGALRSVLALALAVALAPAVAADDRASYAAVGAYCPLPEPGEKPVCLTPAKAEYGDFFAAVEEGQVDDSSAGPVEADLSIRDGSARAYLALSSISYGYWLLAKRIASTPARDPALMARLEHWNGVLLAAYGEQDVDPEFRAAVHSAAIDLQRRTPRSGPSCGPGEACESAETLVQTLATVDANAGLRSPLERLMRRLWPGKAEDEIAQPVSDQR